MLKRSRTEQAAGGRHFCPACFGRDTPPASTFIEKRDGGIPNDVARLRGARFVVCKESDDGAKLAISRFKEMTSKETISDRFMRSEFFDFRPLFKIWFATNHKPRVPADDQAIWDRLRLIPFEARFEGAAEDKSLEQKLSGEMPGILAWAVEGCLLRQREGLEPVPANIRGATE